MPEEKGALDEFAQDFPEVDKQIVDPFETPKEKQEEVPAKEEDPAAPKPKDNREARRAKEALQKEREANIALTERVKVLSEVEKFRKGEPDADLHAVLFGGATPTDETKATTERLQKVLEKFTDTAKQSALAEFKREQAEAQKAEREAEDEIDQNLESLEDQFDADFTSNSPAARKARHDLLEIVKKISPKDSEGNIERFGDFTTAYEIYQERKAKPDTSKQKELAARSLTKSGSSPTQNLEQKSNEDYLKSLGII